MLEANSSLGVESRRRRGCRADIPRSSTTPRSLPRDRYAPRRLTALQSAWLNGRDASLKAAAETLGPELRLRCRGGNCREADRRDTERRLWSAARTANAAPRGLLEPGAIGPLRPGWAEMHLGDGCGQRSPSSPFGAYRELLLASLPFSLRGWGFPRRVAGDAGGATTRIIRGRESRRRGNFRGNSRLRYRAAALDAGPADLTLVTSTDCDLPHPCPGPSFGCLERDGFRGDRSVLEAPGLRAWYTNNPADHFRRYGLPVKAHPKLKAAPLGVSRRRAWVDVLDGREADGERPYLLACCLRRGAGNPEPKVSTEERARARHCDVR